MRSLFIFFIALVVIGAGCVFRQPSPETPDDFVAVPESLSLLGVAEVWEEEARTLFVRTDTGVTEEILWPDNARSPEALGSLWTIEGERDPATLRIRATSVAPFETRPVLVTTPQSQATVTSPLIVHGFARTTNAEIVWRVLDHDGFEISTGTVLTDVAEEQAYVPFSFELFLPALQQTAFTVEAYDPEQPDQIATVSLVLLNTETSQFYVYFPNAARGSSEDCQLVFPVARSVAQTSAVGRAALLELLKGPTPAEREEGYATSLPEEVVLHSLIIASGTATADFSSELNSAGSCRVSSIRSQIETTLQQFPTVADVVVSVNGETETALQP